MKAKLSFKLPKEKYEFNQAVNGWKYASCLLDIWNKFRELDKYDDRSDMPIEEARQFVIDIFSENNVTMDEL
jgi:hypothetical protein